MTPEASHQQVHRLWSAGSLWVAAQGFSASVNAILENLPRRRQTMLFSATQTKSVKDLARLSLRDPTYIAVHAEAAAPTPVKLQQVHVPAVCEACLACLHLKATHWL